MQRFMLGASRAPQLSLLASTSTRQFGLLWLQPSVIESVHFLKSEDGLPPQIKIDSSCEPVSLNGKLNVRAVEQKLQALGHAKRSAEIFDSQGNRIAGCTKVSELLRLQTFNIRIDRRKEIVVKSDRAWKRSLSLFSPSEKDFFNTCTKEYAVNDMKARPFTKLYSYVLDKIQNEDPSKKYTHELISMYLRDATSRQALEHNQYQRRLLNEQTKIRKHLNPMLAKMENAKEMAHQKANRAANLFVGTIVGQFALTQYCTYSYLSWDIVEPVTCCMSLSEVIMAYFFWLYARRDFGLDGFRAHFYEKHFRKALKRENIDIDTLEQMQAVDEEIDRKIKKL